MTKIKTSAAVVLAVALSCSAASAQGTDIAFGPWVGLFVNSAGAGPCQNQNCVLFNFDLNTLSGTGGTMTTSLYGEANQPYVLAVGVSANQCTSIPGIANSLMLDFPVLILAQGTMPSFFGPSICGNGSAPGRLDIVTQIPAGMTLAFDLFIQGLVFDTGAPAFTCTIRIFS